ncbi:MULTISPECIES: imidazole glycerol phosphate synthase subunit HisH [unclassified Nostoc]|uniref:imidazole glycerol phosphate synthase subunit HisH n=1 Tax=unclassified Nostoc TaxID=2593658 RepID=UPI0013D59801|nr:MULTISPECIES: imidazole glycerol phosphate synthase subunit HisH [unclassified Nostoc]MBE8998093.1 imidazole glycerol phosphate synthase subunit HisH [Nostoc sp. LEGE 12447]NEU80793.1 imidazole glycerol phosphate synthase subunit HisH [Nostoc sp. UIC 10630]
MNQSKIAIIDYGMGNLSSVANAFNSIECHAFVTNNPEDLCEASHIILPGVGAFSDGIKNLQSGGWIKFLETEVIEKKKSFLGICLGMQLLATAGTEHGYHKGLNWIPGTVNRLKSNERSIRVPHIGWNDVYFLNKNGLYRGLGNSQVFYFVHSYVFIPEKMDICSALTSHGSEFISSIEMGNIYATQFHPEKSQKAGLEVLRNFVYGKFINNA